MARQRLTPFLVGCVGGEVLVEEVQCDGLVVLAVRGHFELPFPLWRHTIFPHQPSHPMASELDAILGKLVMDVLCAVGLRRVVRDLVVDDAQP
jgi:hypothetical protein